MLAGGAGAGVVEDVLGIQEVIGSTGSDDDLWRRLLARVGVTRLLAPARTCPRR
ncbi:hypothetical protein [Streptomyces sp. NPDC015345]|uniref:hypothetical protein n=1 Tax=Streptomyces sp. NPDC015345 TaxID=3364953 RepID=UPI0036FFEBEF